MKKIMPYSIVRLIFLGLILMILFWPVGSFGQTESPETVMPESDAILIEPDFQGQISEADWLAAFNKLRDKGVPEKTIEELRNEITEFKKQGLFADAKKQGKLAVITNIGATVDDPPRQLLGIDFIYPAVIKKKLGHVPKEPIIMANIKP